MNENRICGIKGIPEVSPGDDIPTLIIKALDAQGEKLNNGDIVVVTSKVISKSEGRIIHESEITPSELAVELYNSISNKNAHEIKVVLRESSRPVNVTDRVMIMETKHGFVCANAGIDRSNVKDEGTLLLLPKEPDKSADIIRRRLQEHYDMHLAVIISDTFGRPWSMGQTNIAIGISGMPAITDNKGQIDQFNPELQATEIAVADEIARATELVMNKTDGIPVATVKGYSYAKSEGRSTDLVRSRKLDLFR
ncbi:coenzyme F420-0:L-glutamate ligase [Alkalihalobacterium alkalinitrilicum]|uniref:coenzyme F420-0:L-glutamate ligase n=1 Tax=Alkalihalobacterium alkalinitrilicum TaxID=427920 RepID=UPI0009957181|nr:coenzyme F420-0:L-glutamate ligase [Alkalihalobacterium alkalinitrilicum]